MQLGKVTLWGATALAAVLLPCGAYMGLVWAPPEREMGDVYRIIYAHVPAVWMALVALTVNFGACVSFLLKKSWAADALAESTAEVGLVFGVVGVALGSIWGKPTWGVWWTWDPRITTAAIMLVAYAGYMALRKFIDDPDRRAVWSAVVGIIAFVDLPIIWFSVKWWNSLHQVQSSPKTVDPQMTLSLRVNAFAFLFLMIAFVIHRYRLAMADRADEVALPPEANPLASPPGGESREVPS